jgi:two-component system, response regulator
VRHKVILLMEDNLSDINLIKHTLTLGHVTSELVVVQDEQKALNYLFGTDSATKQGNFIQPALIVIDLKSLKAAGLAVLQKVKNDERTNAIPLVVLGSFTEERDLKECYGLGANSCLRKPVDINEFTDTVNQMFTYWILLNESLISYSTPLLLPR